MSSTPTTTTPKQKKTHSKKHSHSDTKPQQHHHHNQHRHSHHSQQQQQTPSQQPQQQQEQRFAWSSYQNAPDATEVPKPSLTMLANAREARLSWVPKSLPTVPVVVKQVKEEEMALNLMKMLGVSKQE
jgi:hypothetical protein